MRKTELTFIITFSLLFLCGSLTQAAIVESTDDPMAVGGGARSIGMGKAFAAVADNADTMFINPAGLAGLKGPEAMAMFTKHIQVSGVIDTMSDQALMARMVELASIVDAPIPLALESATLLSESEETIPGESQG